MNIHVVSLQVPYPADYGGAIDIFYKLKELRREGFQIILHSYIYDREESPVLKQLCHEVHYYKRSKGFLRQLSATPYIVNTRRDKQLLHDLCQDDAPILFEGLHTCYLLDHPALRNRKKIVRMHNIEHKYYWQLAKQNPWSWKAIYYTIESLRLRWFERKLKHASLVCAITKADKQELGQRYPTTEIIHLHCFFDVEFPETPLKTEPFVLYHGNLSV
ncbi:MAG: glycosyltransferase family 1 protein, partial [Bacteroidaceae bacterium]|nr:glycosyltransferase family 1 protein [Bacteroidaceae bacterium]